MAIFMLSGPRVVIGVLSMVIFSASAQSIRAEVVSTDRGLCILYDPASAFPNGEFRSINEAVATGATCNLEHAAELGFVTSYVDYRGRPRALATRFIPRAPLVSEENCGIGQVPSVLNGQSILFDSAFRAGSEDIEVSGYDPRTLDEVPETERAAEHELVSAVGLTPFEVLGLKGYMGESYEAWNGALRTNGPIDAKYAARIRLAASGLAKMVTEDRGYVMRGLVRRHMTMPNDKLLALYPEGRCVPSAGFSSASETGAGDGPNRFGSQSLVILSKTAARVSGLAWQRFAEEREVIFRPGTVFRVWKTMPNPDVPFNKKIVLEECPCL